MILGFISGVSTNGDYPELCLVPDKPATFSVPVKIRTLEPTDSAVHLLSIEEGITISIDPDDQGRIIAAIPPASLYLTPNRNEKPGFRVARIKVLFYEGGRTRVMFNRERGWEDWNPNIRLY